MSRPKLELSLAATAFQAAREAKANLLSPNLYKKAEDYLLKAQDSYKKKYFAKSKQYALLCKEYSEQAEFEAIRKSVMGEQQVVNP